MRYLDRLQPLGLLVLRIVLGVIMIFHGYSKVFGDLSHHMQTVIRIGFPSWFAYLSAGTEFFGGILVIAGLLTRLVGVAMTFEMAVAILIQNQAQLAKDMTQIRRDFDEIKRILIRHEQLLANLPEAIREKIGFKGQ